MRLGLIDGHNHCRHEINAWKHVRLELLPERCGLFAAAAQQAHPDVEGVVAKDENRAAVLQ